MGCDVRAYGGLGGLGGWSGREFGGRLSEL